MDVRDRSADCLDGVNETSAERTDLVVAELESELVDRIEGDRAIGQQLGVVGLAARLVPPNRVAVAVEDRCVLACIWTMKKPGPPGACAGELILGEVRGRQRR